VDAIKKPARLERSVGASQVRLHEARVGEWVSIRGHATGNERPDLTPSLDKREPTRMDGTTKRETFEVPSATLASLCPNPRVTAESLRLRRESACRPTAAAKLSHATGFAGFAPPSENGILVA